VVIVVRKAEGSKDQNAGENEEVLAQQSAKLQSASCFFQM